MAGLVVCGLTASVSAQQEKSIYDLGASQPKYKTGGFKPAPEKIETHIGKLEFPGGYPTEEMVQRVHDELDLQRATQLYLDMYPTLSLTGMMVGTVRDWDVKSCSQISVTANEKPADVSAANWVKTLPDQGLFVHMRYYGPLKAFNDKSWVPNDVELVKLEPRKRAFSRGWKRTWKRN